MLVCTGTCGHPSTRSAVFEGVVGSPVILDQFLLMQRVYLHYPVFGK
jgi:hypothetical protein